MERADEAGTEGTRRPAGATGATSTSFRDQTGTVKRKRIQLKDHSSPAGIRILQLSFSMSNLSYLNVSNSRFSKEGIVSF